MNRKRLYKIVVFAIVLMIFSINAKAQYSSEEELKEAANQFFSDENYIEALPLFTQLLSTYPKDPNYNYKYGASALFAKNDKQKPLKYLKFAVSRANVDPIAYYFLAKAQHLNYNFDAAIVYYNKFKSKGSAKDIQRFSVSRQVEMCENGKSLLKSIVDIGVIDKKEIKETEFFRSYALKGINGKVTVKPDDFMSKLDRKKKENSLIYIGGTKEKIIFSSYGKTENSGRDLFSIERSADGGWSEPTTLGLGINTKYDENYPFLHPDGKTLYFCSKGYNSMGGYDVFKSVFNSGTGAWSKPENLDFPINTPGDDVMYISDEDNKLAYFASSRASKQGKLIVYHVTVDSKPNIKSVVKGIFLAEENPSMKSATITIRDVEKDKRYAVYTTHDVTGEYMLVFPSNGGKFKILVETTNDAPVHSAIIEIPKLDDERALKQELILVGTGDDEKLVVKNLFDESDEFDINDPLYVENVLKVKANLDVNTTEEEALNSLQSSLENAIAENEASSFKDLSDEELLNQTNEKADKLLTQTKKSREQSDFAYQEANQKSAKAKALYNEALNTSDENEAATKKSEASKLINESVALLSVARSLESEANERESDVTTITNLQETINSDIEAGNRAEAEKNASKLDEIASATYQEESIIETEQDFAEENLVVKEKTYRKNRDNVTALINREIEIKEGIDRLEEKIAETKKKKDIEAYTSQVDALKIDAEDVEFDLDKAKSKADQSEKEYLDLKNEIETTNNVIADINKSNSIATTINDGDKLRIENDIAYLEKEGVVGVYETENNIETENVATNNTPYSFAEDKDEYEIVNDEGELIDYNTQFGNELVDVDAITDENEKRAKTIEVNNSWIAALNEEIKIREKQIATSNNNSDKINFENRVEELEKLKFEKREEIASLELVADINSNNETNNNVNENSTNSNNEINEGGIDGNYAENLTNELEQFDGEDTHETYLEKAKIHTKWIAAIDNDIEAKNALLATVDESEKSTIENQIAILENEKSEQEEFVSIYEMQAESLPSLVAENNEVTNNNETESNEVANNSEENIIENNTSEEDNELVTNETENNEANNTLENTSPNYEAKLTEELEQFPGEDTYETYTEKAAIHTKWVEAIDNDITSKQEELAKANENEKSSIENEIAILENNKAEQQEFVDLYEMQAESIAPAIATNTNEVENNEVTTNNEIETNEAVNNNEENVEENNTSENTSNTTNIVPVVGPDNLTENNLNAAEDEFSNLKYNNKYDYKSSQSTKSVEDVAQLKNEARQLEVEANDLLLSTSAMEDQEEKDAAITKSEELEEQSERKQEEIAKIYENANRSEFFNNESIISQLKKANNNVSAQNATIAEMTADESAIFYDQAKELRNSANNATSYTVKEKDLQKAYELEMKAIERQNKAIAIYSAGGDEELTAIAENNNASNERITNTTEENNTAETNNSENVANETNNETNSNNSTETEKTNTTTSNNETNTAEAFEIYEPLAISLPSDDIKAEADRLVKEAEVLNVEATALTDSATIIKKKKEREPIELRATEVKAEAARKLKEAEVLYAKVDGMKEDEGQLSADLSSNRTAVANEQLTNTEKETVTNLSAATINSTINSNDYQEYAEAKKTTRRLVIEAQVEYIAADEAQQEAEEQKTLGVSLNAMAAGASTPEAKAKLEGQIEKLNTMIEENETKATDLRASATAKEKDALSNKEKTDLILINASEEDANNIVAIEKVGAYDAELFNEINNKTDELATNERVANNETSNENTTETNSETEVNNEVENNTAENNVVETTNNGVETEVENNTNEVVENTSTAITPENIDEIPEVLNQSIFKIGGNQASYSNSKPIPTAVSLPEGLVFKVQIGAFRNPIPQNHFKGFAPIVKENAGNGITRYTAGLFKGINMAVEAKNTIRSIGYSDAFVVAFFNGKRISIAEARAKLGEEPSNENLANNTTENTTNTEDNNLPNERENTTSTNTEENNTAPDTEEVKDGVSTDVRNIDGVFFTIQVGVYSKSVSSNQLQNVTPLNSERTAGGLIRYTSGVYKTLSEANAAKDRIRALGIADAFVVAYNGGQKITVAQANDMLANNSSSPIVNEEEVIEPVVEETTVEEENVVPTPIIEEEVPEPVVEEIIIEEPIVEEETVTEEETPIVNEETTVEDLNLEYKVQLGAYEEDVPVEDAGIFLRLTGRGVKNFEEDGKTIYTIGSFPDYNSALDLQIEMKELGVKKPKILAFRDGDRIEVEKALELQKNNQ